MPQILLIAATTCLAFAFAAFAGNTGHSAKADLEIVVEGISNSRGNVRLAVFSSDDAPLFPDRLPPLKRSIPATGQATTFRFSDLAAGHYAALAFHDENGNEVLDHNWLGIPKEPWGVTGKRPFGHAPGYAESTFELSGKHQQITIHLE